MKKSALAAIEEHGTLVAAARSLGIDPHTISRWCKKDPEYAAKVAEAKAFSGKYHILDKIEQEFSSRALAGKDDPQSAVIGMFLAKKHDPSYRENAQLQVNVHGPVAIQFNLSQAPLEAKRFEQADTEAE